MSHSHGWQPTLIFSYGRKRVRIKSDTYQVAIVIRVEVFKRKKKICLFAFNCRDVFTGTDSWLVGFIQLLAATARSQGHTDISAGAKFIFRMICCSRVLYTWLFSWRPFQHSKLLLLRCCYFSAKSFCSQTEWHPKAAYLVFTARDPKWKIYIFFLTSKMHTSHSSHLRNDIKRLLSGGCSPAVSLHWKQARLSEVSAWGAVSVSVRRWRDHKPSPHAVPFHRLPGLYDSRHTLWAGSCNDTRAWRVASEEQRSVFCVSLSKWKSKCKKI